MNILDAARHLVRRFPGGIECLAIRLGKRPSTLRHEVAGSDAYKLGLQDAELITQLAIEQHVENPLQLLNVLATNCGAVLIPLPGLHDGGGATFEDLAATAKEFAEFVAATSSAVADGHVTGNELRDVDRELSELIGCAQRVRAGLAAIHAAEKPAALLEREAA
ncbi:phage regulatory CII family protein [Variovorax boronicumulans]|uniref:phage regulatory CII family protein n=1 Tax=Variovorax boronicumulans TaxID=436515 RepID=UPI002784553D|nr:phage regulatory CII family protein [Variovorax boronicumulans]MDQ0040843.1 hypothetical protein [Variovorax boronicumulans]